MSTIQPGINTYQQTAVQSTPPDKLLIMLYDGAIRFLNLAKEGLEERNHEIVNTNLQKAQNIITELMVTLNMDYEISRNLYLMYEYFNGSLIRANIKKSCEPIDEVLGHLTSLRETWVQASILVKKESTPAGRLNFAG